MHEKLIGSIAQGSHNIIPVYIRQEKLILPAKSTLVAKHNSHIVPTSAAEHPVPLASDAPSILPTPIKSEAKQRSTSKLSENNAVIPFDMELLERLRTCNPALTLLTTDEVAAIFRVSVKKLENDRYQKRGLKYHKNSGTVRYRLSDILAELDKAQ